jgi:hypothetical protein
MKTTKLKVIFVPLLCAGCVSPVIKSELAAENQPGLVYALPKGQVELEVIRKIVSEDDVKAATKAVDSTKAALDAAEAHLKEATKARESARHEVDALTIDNKAAEKEKLEFKLVLATVTLRARTAEVAVAKTQHTEAVKRLGEAQRNVNKMEQTVTLKTAPSIADPSRRYVAQLQPSLFRDDSVKLSISNGLLNTTTSESTGQSGNILVSLASAISGARAGGTSTPKIQMLNSEPKTRKPGEKKTCEPFAQTWVFDPTDDDDVSRVATDIAGTPKSLIVLKQPHPALKGANAVVPKEHQGIAGLAYRVPVTVTIEVQLKSDTDICEVSTTDAYASLTATVPDSKATYFAAVNGASFTKTKVEYSFKEGMLISFNSDQPSQAAAVAKLPVEILKAIIEVPASILKLRVDYDSQAEALIKERTDQLKAQVDLINAQKALSEARKD